MMGVDISWIREFGSDLQLFLVILWSHVMPYTHQTMQMMGRIPASNITRTVTEWNRGTVYLIQRGFRYSQVEPWGFY